MVSFTRRTRSRVLVAVMLAVMLAVVLAVGTVAGVAMYRRRRPQASPAVQAAQSSTPQNAHRVLTEWYTPDAPVADVETLWTRARVLAPDIPADCPPGLPVRLRTILCTLTRLRDPTPTHRDTTIALFLLYTAVLAQSQHRTPTDVLVYRPETGTVRFKPGQPAAGRDYPLADALDLLYTQSQERTDSTGVDGCTLCTLVN
jgi:hypothetical protein